MKPNKIIPILGILGSLFISQCKTFPDYHESQSLLGIFVDRGGIGKIGRMSENFSVININSNLEYFSNAFSGSPTRNTDTYTTIALPAGTYQIATISLGGSTFVCIEECQPFNLVSKKIYYAGSYALDVSTGFRQITHKFTEFEASKDEIEKQGFYDYVKKQNPKWLENIGTVEKIRPFRQPAFSHVRAISL